jgi:hypothetical protein
VGGKSEELKHCLINSPSACDCSDQLEYLHQTAWKSRSRFHRSVDATCTLISRDSLAHFEPSVFGEFVKLHLAFLIGIDIAAPTAFSQLQI